MCAEVVDLCGHGVAGKLLGGDTANVQGALEQHHNVGEAKGRHANELLIMKRLQADGECLPPAIFGFTRGGRRRVHEHPECVLFENTLEVCTDRFARNEQLLRLQLMLPHLCNHVLRLVLHKLRLRQPAKEIQYARLIKMARNSGSFKVRSVNVPIIKDLRALTHGNRNGML